MYYNGEQLLAACIQAARISFISDSIATISRVLSGKLFVNDVESFLSWQVSMLESSLEEIDDSMALRQRAYYCQTGKSVALLP